MNHSYNEQNLALKLDLRFLWLNRKYFDIYSSFSVGANYRISQTKYKTQTLDTNSLSAALDFSLLGFTFGNNIYGILEFPGIFSGVKLGLGYKF